MFCCYQLSCIVLCTCLCLTQYVHFYWRQKKFPSIHKDPVGRVLSCTTPGCGRWVCCIDMIRSSIIQLHDPEGFKTNWNGEYNKCSLKKLFGFFNILDGAVWPCGQTSCQGPHHYCLSAELQQAEKRSTWLVLQAMVDSFVDMIFRPRCT